MFATSKTRGGNTLLGFFGLLALILATVLVLATGCGDATVGAEESAGDETAAVDNGSAQERDDSSLFGDLFGPDTETVTVPAGTRVVVELQKTLSSESSQPGETFTARVDQGVAVGGTVVIPEGSTVVGEVTRAEMAKIGGRSKLSLEMRSVELPSGESAPLRARFAQVGKSERAKDAAIIGGSTLGGAILGEAVDEGEGTVVGAIVGGLAGALGAKKTKGKPLVLPDGTELTLELTEPVSLEVEV